VYAGVEPATELPPLDRAEPEEPGPVVRVMQAGYHPPTARHLWPPHDHGPSVQSVLCFF